MLSPKTLTYGELDCNDTHPQGNIPRSHTYTHRYTHRDTHTDTHVYSGTRNEAGEERKAEDYLERLDSDNSRRHVRFQRISVAHVHVTKGTRPQQAANAEA